MKHTKFIFTTLFAGLLSTISFSQNEIILKKGNKTKSIQENSPITIISKEDCQYNGNFIVINDSSIRVKDDSIDLSDIKVIYIKTNKINIWSASITGVGGFYTILSSVFVINTIKTGGIAMIIGIMGGVPMIVISGTITTFGIVRLIKGKRFNNPKWTYYIRAINNNLP